MWRYRSTANELQAKYAALDRVQAVIEFDLDGRILAANANFLAAMGYSLAEIIGKHHSMFVEPAERDHANYQKFWADLRKGDFNAAQFKRLGKGGKEVWIEASYNPLLDGNGKPYKVVKFATDITAQKRVEADRAGQLAAIRKSQAVIEFSLDGTILDANENFLAVTGYTLNEVVGQHHRMFVDPAERQMPAYTAFWSKLRAGEYQAAQYRRIGKGGKEVWIEASYNPIFDPSGRPYKIVKFATDITRQVRLLDNLRVMIDKNFTEIDTAVTKSTAEAQQAAHIAGSTAENVQAMAAASEELAASVAEIASSMSSSRGATDTAFDQVNVATTFTSKLTDAASAMGGIVGLINNIAGQINLLALNATIESARAGEAGRGFAVVAQEVKSLANQAAKATEQISQEIDGVQAISGDVVQALQMILSSVELVRNNVTATAAAVEEQSAVTRDLSANMQGTAAAVTTISNNVVGITAAVTQVNNAMSNTRQAASVLVR